MIAPEYFRPPRRSTFAHLSPVPHLIPRGLSDHRGKRGNDGPGERNVRGRRPELAGRLRLVRMLARIRRVRRRRVTLTTHPSHRSAERVASTPPPVPLFFGASAGRWPVLPSERLMRITRVVAGAQGWSSWLRPRPSKPETRVQIPVAALRPRPSPLASRSSRVLPGPVPRVHRSPRGDPERLRPHPRVLSRFPERGVSSSS